MSQRLRPAGFIEPCQPSAVTIPPAGPDWLHEIKHDGFRLMVWRDGDRVRLFSRWGNDLTSRFPSVAASAAALKAASFLIDGEVVRCNADGLPVFTLLLAGVVHLDAFVWGFDLVNLDGHDLRSLSIEDRKTQLAELVAGAPFGLAFNDHEIGDGPALYQAACEGGLEGIVSKRLGSRYQSGRSDIWRKAKNPDSSAVRREAQIDWSKKGRR